MKPRVTISGYYGYGNAGDEAVLAGLVKGFRAARPADALEIVALSGNPGETQAAHEIGAADRYKPGPLLAAIARSDLFVSGGGSLLQDVTSAHGIFYYLGVVRLAQMLGKKTMFAAQGIGPLNLPRSRRLVASVANRLDAVTVRDAESAQLLREIGVTRPPVEVTADPALLLERKDRPLAPNNGGTREEPNPAIRMAVPGATAPDSLGGKGSELPANRDRSSGSPIIGGGGISDFGVALRAWPGQENLAGLVADACWQPLAESRALLFPMQPQHDLALAEQFAAKWQAVSKAVVCQTQTGPAGLLFNIGSCEMMVGMRLHALILAAACGVPSVALAYDPKVAAFMDSSGQGDAVYDLSRSDPAALAGLIARVWAERSARAEALQAALPSLRARAARNVDVALGLLAS